MASGETSGFGGKEPPPPSWDGLDPAVQLPIYEKNVRLWMYESELESKKRGVRLLRNLTGVARSVADSLEFEEIACEKGVENLLATSKATLLHIWSSACLELSSVQCMGLQEGARNPSKSTSSGWNVLSTSWPRRDSNWMTLQGVMWLIARPHSQSRKT